MEFQSLILPEIEKSEAKHALACNEKTARYQLSLTEKDVAELLASRKEKMKDLELVELKEGILPRMLETFADSPYLFQESYVNDLDQLQFLFYRFKGNHTDEEMLELLKNAYDNVCQGSMQLLIQHLEQLEQEDQKKGKKVFSYLEAQEDFIDYTDGLYRFEELLPVLMRVAKLYMEDSSLSYNEMRKLMSGVSYSIAEGIFGQNGLVGNKPDAGVMYKEGQKRLNQRFRDLKELTKQLFAIFCDYNLIFARKCVYEDLQKLIAGQDVIRTPHQLCMETEYPVMRDLGKQEGLNRLYAYVEALRFEWSFLSKFPAESVTGLLRRYMNDYENNFYDNLASVVLLQSLGCFIAEADVARLQLDEEDLDAIRIYFGQDSIDEIQKNLEQIVKKAFATESGYILPVCREYAVRIHNALEHNQLKNIFL